MKSYLPAMATARAPASARSLPIAMLAAALTLLAAMPPAAALEARLTVREVAGVAREDALVSGGVPFARGAVKDIARLSVAVDGKPAAAQFALLAPWDDGSARWVMATYAASVPANGTAAVAIRDDSRNDAPRRPVKVVERRGAVEVSTGPLQFAVSRSAGPLLHSLKLDGRPLLGDKGVSIVLYTATGEAVAAGAPLAVTVDEAGPLRAAITARGIFPGVQDGLLGYTLRLTAGAGGKAVQARLWLENNGAHGYKTDPQWFHFDGLAVEVQPSLGEPAEAACEDATARDNLKVAQRCPGGKWDNFAFTVTGDGRELKRGARTAGVVALQGPAGRLTVAVRHFWQNYEQAIAWESGMLRLWLWPREAQWPRPEKLGGGGEAHLKDPVYTRPGLNALPGGVHKGYEFALDFSGRPAAATAAELTSPLAAAEATYFAATEAANGLFAPAAALSGHEELDWKFQFWSNMASNLVDPRSAGGLHQVRTVAAEPGGIWFGWMDFGDVCSPRGGWYGGAVTPRNLHHDWVWAVLIQYLRTGDPAFLELGTEMARHQMEIDQNWSDRDAPAQRALLRPDSPNSELHTDAGKGEGSMPRPEHNWVSGIVLYHLLTGDPKARACALRNYTGLRERAILRLRERPTDDVQLESSLLTVRNLLSLHALTGDPQVLTDISSVLQYHLLRRYRDAGPFLFEPRMEVRQQDYHMLGKQFCQGLQALCEYHYRTGDEEVGKILAEACATAFPDTFFEAPLYLADLYAYVGYLTGDEALLMRGMDAFADAFPESRRPPVFRPGQQDWTERIAMMLRTGHTLQFVAWRAGGPGRTVLTVKPGSKGMFPAAWTKPGEPALVKPVPQPDGSLLLDVRGFALKDCDIEERAGARGGRMVVLRQYTSEAATDVPLPVGRYELTIRAYAPSDEDDAFNVAIDDERTRVFPGAMRQLSSTRPVPFTVARDRAVRIRIMASEENGMSVDQVVIRPVAPAP